MPALTSIRTPIKALILGDSGLGKTGALWSLAAAGYNLKIYDADANANVLSSALRGNTKALSRIEVCQFKDSLRINAEGFATGAPKAWPNFLKGLLTQWPDSPADAKENVYTWGPDTVVVLDTLTSLGRAALQNAMRIENKMGKVPEIQHYHTAGFQIKDTLSALMSDDVKCHVLVLTHVKYMDNDLGKMFGLPKAIGEKLSEDVPIFFNTMLALKRSNKKVVLSTKPTDMVQTKVEAFDNVKAEYDLIIDGVGKPGLAEFFHDCGWEGVK